MPVTVPMDIMTPLAMAIPAAMAVAIHACGLLAVAVAASSHPYSHLPCRWHHGRLQLILICRSRLGEMASSNTSSMDDCTLLRCSIELPCPSMLNVRLSHIRCQSRMPAHLPIRSLARMRVRPPSCMPAASMCRCVREGAVGRVFRFRTGRELDLRIGLVRPPRCCRKTLELRACALVGAFIHRPRTCPPT